ncbi:hypothetical protein C7M84_021758 [Penaeus vannamei]|uniref:Uncharacterized protein n=2 Tax=Penaeus vannamei TaxID=6689 RepID=A0A3R7NEC8_PENVA|nr:uncharacterized protein LOC113828214 [Penaeus vannamei]ROT84951.1 hypothetical protein C7M84_021758 [Penaeus vannamei]
MFAKMRLAALCLLWLPCVLSRPAEEVTNREVATSEVTVSKADPTKVKEIEPEDERLRRSPQQWAFQVIDLANPFGFRAQENEIPFATRNKFTPPEHPSKEARERMYAFLLQHDVPPHVHIVLEDEPYFGTFDHAKAILQLQHYRKRNDLTPHMLKSLRPFFPFYSSN